MKKILFSGATLLVVGAMVASATGAFFSDTETSTGNTFAAGAIDLKVDSESHYAGLTCVEGVWVDEENEAFGPVTRPDLLGDDCDGSWAQADLGPEHQFFNLSDIKPGDTGENTISLHVIDNDAWMCADVKITSNDDESTNEPELEAGDVAEDVNNTLDGELAQNLEFAAWIDDGNVDGWQGTSTDSGEGDNLFQEGEVALFAPGPASNILNGTTTLALAQSGDAPISGGVTHYVGLAWCAGTFNPDMSCNGEAMGNIAQTDSMTADISFRAEQSRNNPNFTCGNGPEVVQTTLTLEKVITQDQTDPVTEAAWTLMADGVTTDLSGSEGQPGVTNVQVEAGAYVLSESVLAGFTQTDLQCVGGVLDTNTDTVTVAEGANVTCTFFNTENTLID
ncbi:MAG: hypothetical protein KBD50_02810 [Candidatus Pacebacteria bacterium]|nr:hypothetical protein [Candidatus Paceibacterota bacterium]